MGYDLLYPLRLMVYILEVVVCVLIVLYDRKFSLSLFNMLYWLFFCVVGNLYFADFQDTHLGTNYILLCCILVYCGSYFGKRIKLYRDTNGSANRNACPTEEGKGKILIVLALVLEIVLCVYTFFNRGLSFSSITQFLFDSGASYFEETTDAGILKSAMTLGYSYVISVFSLDGYLIAKKTRRDVYKSKIGLLLPGMALYTIMNGRKSMLIWPLLFWVMGILVATCENTNLSIIQFVWGYAKRYIVIIVLFVCIMLLMFITRSMASGDNRDPLFGFMRYLFGHIPVFNTWFQRTTANSLNYSMGQQTIFGVLDQIGMANSDLYPNYTLLEYGNVGSLSNIFSAYRGFIEDFGKIGVLILNFMFGVILGSAEKKAQNNVRSVMSSSIISIVATFILFSFLISPWHYFTVFVSNVFFICELIYLKKINCKISL